MCSGSPQSDNCYRLSCLIHMVEFFADDQLFFPKSMPYTRPTSGRAKAEF